MKRSTFFKIIFICSFLLTPFLKNEIQAQTVTTIINYTGFQACGGCTVCGDDYWCFNTASSWCGNTAACATTTFANPVPAGNIVTNIAISYYSASCQGSSLTGTINGNAFPTVNEGNTGCACSTSPCSVGATTGSTFPCGVPGYDNTAGGINSFQLCTGLGVCVNRIELTMTYVPANQASPATQPGAISGNAAVCSGAANTYTIPAVANAAGYTWTVPPGWVINSGQNTTSITATPGSAGNICVTANNLCGTSGSTCFPVTLNTPSTAPTIAASTPNPICAGSSTTLSVSGGSLGVGANWDWYSGSCGGTFVGTGSSISVSPGATTTYYVQAQGTCNTTTCASVTVTVNPVVTASWSNPSSICAAAGSISLNPLITGTTGGTWSGTGVSGTTFNPSSGSQSVTYTVGLSPCVQTSIQTITVVPDVNPSWTTPGTVCEAAGNVTLTPTGTAGGVWSGTGVSGTTFNPSGLSGNIAVTYTVGTAPCVETSVQNITVSPDVNPSWTTPGTVCEAAGNITLTPTGTAGGVWLGAGVSGTTFNPSGLSGNIAVTYSVGTAPCVETLVQNINVVPDADPSWTTPGSVCEGAGNVTLTPTGTTGGVWSGTGVSGTTFDPSGLSGNIAVTYTVGTAPCVEFSTQNIQVDTEDDPTFSYPSGTYCLTGTDPTPTMPGTSTSGGTFTISAPGVINPTTGVIDLSGSGLTGSPYTVTYNTTIVGNACPNSTTFQVAITTAPSATFTYDQAAYCQDSLNPLLTYGAGSGGGVFSSTPVGLSLNSTTGAVDLTLSTPNVYTVYYNIAAAGGCAAAIDSTTIEVLQVDDATFSYVSGNIYCEADVNPLATVGGTAGGVFAILPTGTINTGTGEIDLVASGVGTYTVYYNTVAAGNSCPETDSLTITITAQNTILANLSNPICLGDVLSLTAAGSGNGTITWYSDLAGTNVLGTGSPFAISPSSIGTITYYVNETGACPSTMDSVVVVVGGVVANINANPLTGAIPLNVTLDGSGSSGVVTNYSWTFGNGGTGSSAIETTTYPTIGTYVVQLIVADGICSDTTSVTIDAFGESVILIPNVFTPNGDGSNDVFTVDGTNLESVDCEIYNRWGQLMYSWTHAKGYWDGRALSGGEAPAGSYFYIINAKGIDGTEYFKKGSFSLIR